MSDETIAQSTIFERFAELVKDGQSEQAIDALVAHYRDRKEFHELFEALKMQMRFRLGLPAAQSDQQEKLDEATESKIESSLLEACREVGEGLVESGNVREGWMYLRPVGDRDFAAKILQSVQPNDENTDELIEVLVHEGANVARGFEISLNHLGTCNSITLFEQTLAMRPRHDQQQAADLLVRHVHKELWQNLTSDIQNKEGQAPSEESLHAILQARSDLLRDGSYHLDTSHLSSTVRFARVLDDQETLKLALDLSYYGRQLHPQYQYPGEEPFLDLYPASIAFFRALLGEQVDAGIRYFTQKADSVDQNHFGLIAVEVLIDLLSRCGRNSEAIAATAKRIPAGARTMGIAPTLLQLSQRSGDFETMQKLCRERNDLLGFAAASL